ncbi:hypothetical protein P3T76_003343 [Phytophthora citrophthora]|uniref:M96 mating-specific protein family n=1 Tax=Phytophthora citrophthora TaxID=4793 RepID=A0AAD9LPJ8_9STRA|nr:hypothetical protein P3T76_003343 [Phytophthora citrophthora]
MARPRDAQGETDTIHQPSTEEREAAPMLAVAAPTGLALESDCIETSPDTKNSATKKANNNAKTTIPRPKGKRKYNPNRAREQQRKELLNLREKVVEMEQELKLLQGHKTVTQAEVNGNNLEAGEKVVLFHRPAIWKEMANHQLEERLKSERENRRLKSLLERQIKIDTTLAKLLETKLFIQFIGILLYFVLQPMDSCVYDQRSRPTDTRSSDRTGSDVFAELLSSVDDSYREVDDVFKTNELGDMESSFSDARMHVGPDGVYMEMFANKVLPFKVVSTGIAAWKFFANLIEHMPYRFFYQKDQKNLETKGDTVIESFGVGSHANGTQADFRVKQILRRYVVEDRVVIVWRSLIDLVEFSGSPLCGAAFQEKGYVVVRRPHGMAENFALLQICYRIHPNTPVHSLSGDSVIANTLTDLVLNGTAAKIASGYQTIENILFNESIQSC